MERLIADLHAPWVLKECARQCIPEWRERFLDSIRRGDSAEAERAIWILEALGESSEQEADH